LVLRNDILGGGEGEGLATDAEGDVLCLLELAVRDDDDLSVRVYSSALNVAKQGGDVRGVDGEEGRTGVDDTSSLLDDLFVAERDRVDIEAPVVLLRRDLGEGNVVHLTLELGRVNTANVDLTVYGLVGTVGDGSEVNSDDLGRDLLGVVPVVHGSGDDNGGVGTGGGTSKIGGAKSNDTLDTNLRGVASNTEFLLNLEATDVHGILEELNGDVTRAIFQKVGKSLVFGSLGLGRNKLGVGGPEQRGTGVEEELGLLGGSSNLNFDVVREISVEGGDDLVLRLQLGPTVVICLVGLLEGGLLTLAKGNGDRAGRDGGNNGTEEKEGSGFNHCGLCWVRRVDQGKFWKWVVKQGADMPGETASFISKRMMKRGGETWETCRWLLSLSLPVSHKARRKKEMSA